MASLSFLLFLFASFACLGFFSFSEAQAVPPTVRGLSYTFYNRNCPNLEKIIRDRLRVVFRNDIGQAAGLLRIHFHDCFVRGCDGSVLLDGSTSGPGQSEKLAPPNLSLRAEGFRIINDLRNRLQNACGRVVSCADITALAARDAVFLSGGPDYKIPLGRRDGLTFATLNETLDNLPPPSFNTTSILSALNRKQLDATDSVALSGAHTIGIGACTSFTDRLYPVQDPTLNKFFASQLRLTCPAANTTNTTNLDVRTPNLFDNKYFVNLMNRQGLFTSDQDLFTDRRTKPIVQSFALNQTLFFEKFVFAMIKMSQLDVLTGTQGEIRANCSARNPTTTVPLTSVVDGEEGESVAF